MPYLTPDELPEERDCRALSIPANTDWLALVSGALTELTKPYNWAQWGAVTVDEAVEAMQAMVDEYYAGCASCELPGGSPVFRLNPDTWEVEELVGGEWVAPEGDYELPPTPAREESTQEERRCYAAANAANALKVLYEQLADDFADGLSQLEAKVSFAAAVTGAIGAAFGLVTAPLLTLAGVLFGIVYVTTEFLTADLWDEEFTDKLECFFYECAVDTGDVVHFDLNCVFQKIAEATTIDWDANELRLLLQIGTIMSMLGSQAIDAAGATTAITSTDCDGCPNEWCFTFDLEETDASGSPLTVNGCTASYVSGLGWRASKGGGCAPVTGQSVLSAINISFTSTYIRYIVVVATCQNRTQGGFATVAFPAIDRGGTPAVQVQNIDNDELLGAVLSIEASITGITAEAQCTAASGVAHSSGDAIVKQVTFYGTGDCPFGSPNCIES